MKRIRMSTNLPEKLAADIKDKVAKLGYPSVSAFLESAAQHLLGHADVVKENKTLREKRRACAKQLSDYQEQARQLTCDIEALKNQRDEAIDAKNWAFTERDTFKCKYEDCLVAYNKSQSELRAYQNQGFWGRVFNLVPKGE